MKTRTKLATFGLVILLAGCTTQTAYQTIAATETAVLAANTGYLDSVVTGQTPTNSVPVVEAAFNDTQMAIRAAAAVASGGSAAPVPATVAIKAQNFTNLVHSVKGGK